MASTRMGSGPASRAGDGLRPRKAGSYMDAADESSTHISRRTRRDVESIRAPIQPPSQTKLPSRIAQNASTRKPAIPHQPGRPALSHQAQSWGSTSTGSVRSVPHLSTMSGSSSSGRSQDSGSKPARNVLRRKQSGFAQDTPSLRNDSISESTRTSSTSSIPRSRSSLDPAFGFPLDRGITESPTEVRVAHSVELPKTQAQTVTIYPELDRYREITTRPSGSSEASSIDMLYRLATHDLPPPTPVFSGTSSQLSAFSGSPSTRFSGSPGPGPYSRDTTPTSMSSQSPGLVAPIRIAPPRMKPVSPAHQRPPVTRRRAGSVPNEVDAISADPHGLAAVRESLTSSSSNSTVRDGDKKHKKKKRLSPMPPSPPPRKSSQKFRNDRDDEDSPSRPTRQPAQPVMTLPSPVKSPSTHSKPAISSRATPPIRPSRDGTPDLQSQLFGPLPIIHSNLSSTSLSGERYGNEPLSGSPLPRSTTPSSFPDRYQQPSRLPVGREATPAPRVAPIADTKKKPETGRPTRTPSPNTSTFHTRFPFFGRRAKTAPEIPLAESKDKPARKGPAAGTGHEGYGRLGAVRRRSGGSSNLPRAAPGPLSSQESLNSNHSGVDPFLLERMNPVVIAGGEVVENRNASSELSRTESSQSFAFNRQSIESKGSSEMSTTSSAPRHTLWPSAFPRGHHPALSNRRPSDSSDSEALAMKPTIAFRRSIQRLRTSPDNEPLRIPRPINTSGVGSPSLNSLDTSVVSDDSHLEIQQEALRGRNVPSTTPKKLTKRARSPRKWNIFSRSQSQPASTSNKKVEALVEAVPATAKTGLHKPVAFYTMMDGSELEDNGTPDVEEVLREAHVFDDPTPRGPEVSIPRVPEVKNRVRRPSLNGNAQKIEPGMRRIQIPLASQAPRTEIPAISRAPPAARAVEPPQPTQPAAKPRPSRLPQVGRIPKVVSARPEQTSPKSFSRPFNRVSFQIPPQAVTDDIDSVAKGPSPPKPSTPELTHEESTGTSAENTSPSRYSLGYDVAREMTQIGREFIAFSPRKNSLGTTGTSSSSCSGIYSYVDTLAAIDTHRPLVEDDIWDEYNDLIGEVPPSATSSKGMPFHLENRQSRPPQPVVPALESPTIILQLANNIDGVQETEKAGTASSVYSADMTERIKAAFAPRPEEDPATPFSVSEFVHGYHDRNNSTDMGRKQLESSQRNSSSSRKSRKSDSSKSSEDESPLSQVNLRVGSMTVSKWLTFGHVLFSPARDELLPVVGSLKRHSVLVVDGLGNDDWSFYAAETYPAATFFNLSPRAPLPDDHQSSATFPLSPPNHHQIQFVSHLDKFPFGPETFTTVVYRFPAAAPESHYRNIVTEARRVLKPGGYLELSILDLDLNNMGNRGRRAVRRFKERIHDRSPDTSLGSSSDLILRLLGKKGFADIKNCRVGVPVASPITRPIIDKNAASKNTKTKAKDQRSLAEMMNDDGDIADENITNMVAKVGRWWYSRCYESAASSGPGNKSIWTDRPLIAECEEWGTSLKLMVCYARVPERSRVASI